MKILSDEKLCPTKACIFRLFYWTKATKFVKVTKILFDEKECTLLMLN